MSDGPGAVAAPVVPAGPGSLSGAGDRRFRAATLAMGLVVIGLAVAVGFQLSAHSLGIWRTFGASFLWTSTWDPVGETFGARPFIWGTLVSSAIAMAIAVPLGLGSAIFLAELAPRRISDVCTFLIELLAAVPTVILGLLGIFLLVPAVRSVEPFLDAHLGFLPFFRGAPYGVGMLAAGILLAFIIVPYITSISREVILTVPRHLKEAALALGATRWEMVRMVILPFARSGVAGAVFLALGRALGETMAVTMVIGNTPQVSWSVLDPAYSMAAVLANEFAEAASEMHTQALIAVGLVLFVITIGVNAAARWMIARLAVAEASA